MTSTQLPTPIDDLTVEDVKKAHRLLEYYYEQGWTDGFPVVPPIQETLEEYLDYVGRDPNEVLISAPHLGRTCTVELATINAIMAGCRKEHLPVVLTAVGMFDGAQPLMQSTNGTTTFLCVNGPIRESGGFNSKGNVFGPGFRANATVGRAMRLIIMNALDVRPHEFDQSTQGTPAKYSFCIAENEEESPWEPLHVERGFSPETSTVTAQFAKSCLHIDNRFSNKPEEVLRTIADSMSYGGAWQRGWGRAYTVVMGPTHAQMIAKHGWEKADVKEFLWEHFGRRIGDMRSWGLYDPAIVHQPFEGSWVDGPDDLFLRFAESPESIALVVAGAQTGGVSAVVTHFSPANDTRAIDDPTDRRPPEARPAPDAWHAPR